MKRSDKRPGAPVWDLPLRLFHWGIVGLIGLSWWSAEESYDQVHFWSGYTLLFLLIFRIFWGFAGGSTARFAGFVPKPSALFAYLRTGQHDRAGHTPLGALSVIAMLLALIVQVASGLIQMDEDDFVEGPLASLVGYDVSVMAHDVHEISFNILLGLIGLHLVAIFYYQFVKRRSLVRAMITGRSDLAEGMVPMRPARSGWHILAAVAAALILTALIVLAPSLA